MARNERDTRELQERVVKINRVAKVVKGGRRFSFTALVVVGDEVDRVGVGYGKANEVPSAIAKAVEDAKKNMFQVPKYKTTITHQTIGRYGAGRVMLKPASEGTGVIAGAGVRAVLELGGVRDILAKSLGTANPINLLMATVDGLKNLKRPEEVAKLRGKTVAEVIKPHSEVVAEQAAAVEAAAVAAARGRVLMAKLRITQVRSTIRTRPEHRGTMRALGLRKINQTSVHEDSPVLQGMLRKVASLVKVENDE